MTQTIVAQDPSIAALHAATPVAPEAELVAPDTETVTAQEMARLTGVARERLRTWERRHGFPTAIRSGHGNRHYPASEVRLVIAVRQLAAHGLPLSHAVEMARDGQITAMSSLASLGEALDRTAMPAIAIAGPAPLEIVWTNTATLETRAAAGFAGGTFDAMPQLGREALDAVQRLLALDRDAAEVVAHSDWVSEERAPAQSLAWRVSAVQADRPVVVLMQLPIGTESAPEPAVADTAQLALATQWTTCVREARDELGEHPGLRGVQRSVRRVARGTGALDGFLTICDGDVLRCGTSVHGSLPARVTNRASCPEVSEALSSGEVTNLSAVGARGLGLGPGAGGLVVPLLGGGHAVGAVILVFPGAPQVEDGVCSELLLAYGTLVATILQRDRAAAQALHARRAAAGVRATG